MVIFRGLFARTQERLCRHRLWKRLQHEGHIVFVHGKGHRKTPLQKAIEKTEDFLHKTKEYAVQLHYCGDRNSYAKTDIDATFMHLKEDAMKNEQVKPAYNVQYGVDAGFVTWVTVESQTSDCTTLLPFLEDFRKHFHFQSPVSLPTPAMKAKRITRSSPNKGMMLTSNRPTMNSGK